MKFHFFLLALSLIAITSCVTIDPNDTKVAKIIDADIDVETTFTDIFVDSPLPDYKVTDNNWLIRKGLIIEPGVVIEFASGTLMTVSYEGGYIIADGTAENPITFTGEGKINGIWKGVLITSPDVRNKINHCTIEYAGGGELNYKLPNSGLGISYYAGEIGSIAITNSTIKNSAGYGLSTDADAVIKEFASNTFSNNEFAAIYTSPNEASKLDNSSVYNDGNGYNGVEIFDARLNYPTELQWKNLNNHGKYKISGDLYIESGLVIEPNTTIQVGASNLIRVAYDDGYLTAEGTVNEPITFEGLSKTAGFWKGIVFNSEDIRNSMDYCIVTDAGGGELEYVVQNANIGVIYYAGVSSRLSLTNSTISNGLGCGVSFNDPAMVTESNNIFTNLGSSNICAD